MNGTTVYKGASGGEGILHSKQFTQPPIETLEEETQTWPVDPLPPRA